MISCDLLVKNQTCVLARTKKGLFQFAGNGIAEHLRERCRNLNGFPPDDQILQALADISGLSAGTDTNRIAFIPSLPPSSDYVCGQPQENLAEQVMTVFNDKKCRRIWIGCWTPNGYVGLMRLRSSDEIASFERFRHRLALAVDEEAHYAAAAAWLSGDILCDGGLPIRVAKRIERALKQTSPRTVFMVFDRETGKRLRPPALSGKGHALRPYVTMGSIVYEIRHQRPSSEMHWVFARYAIPNAQTERVTHGCWAVGRDPDPTLASVKAIAEATERYGSGDYEAADLITGSWQDLRDQAIDPRAILRFDVSQYKLTNTIKPFDKRRTYRWTAGVRADKSQVLILADLVYYPFNHGDAPYAYANSSGVAAHLTREEAERQALLELIERDAVMRIWRHRIVLPTVSRATLPTTASTIVKQLEHDGYELRIHWVTFARIPTVFVSVVSQDYGRWPNFTCAAASHQLPSIAVVKAVQEADASLRTFGPLPKKRLHPEEVRHVIDHGLFAADPANRKIYGAFFSQPSTEIPIPADDRTLPGELRQAALFVDLTPRPIVGQASLCVVRAFVPGLVPMTFGTGLEPLGMYRMRCPPYSVRQDREALDRHGQFPHPFS